MNSWNNCCCGGFLSCWLEVQVTSGQTHNSPGLPQLLCLCQEDAQHVVLFRALDRHQGVSGSSLDISGWRLLGDLGAHTEGRCWFQEGKKDGSLPWGRTCFWCSAMLYSSAVGPSISGHSEIQSLDNSLLLVGVLLLCCFCRLLPHHILHFCNVSFLSLTSFTLAAFPCAVSQVTVNSEYLVAPQGEALESPIS